MTEESREFTKMRQDQEDAEAFKSLPMHERCRQRVASKPSRPTSRNPMIKEYDAHDWS